MTDPKQETSLTIVDPGPGVVLPVGDAGHALAEYRRVQKTLDEQMPEAIVTISGKRFRRRMYWTAISAAFGIDVDLVSIDRLQEGDDWGYVAVARATAPNGRHVDGDGACFASEKRGAGQRTVHNVRAHAVTRAKNRAVSDLCGFGEVSADELTDEGAPAPGRGSKNRAPSSDDHGEPLATEAQMTMLRAKSYDRARDLGNFGEEEDSKELHKAAALVRKAALAFLSLEAGTAPPRHAVDALARLIDACELDDGGMPIIAEPEEPF